MLPEDLPESVRDDPALDFDAPYHDDEIDRIVHAAKPDDIATDFSDLDAIVDQGLRVDAVRDALGVKIRRLHRIRKSDAPEHQSERAALVAAIRKLEEGVVWRTVGKVALLSEQHCLACGAAHRWFEGWMTEQRHATDRTASRLIAGKPVEELPARYEVRQTPDVELCASCVEVALRVRSLVEEEAAEVAAAEMHCELEAKHPEEYSPCAPDV